jgi:von Willebrand factor type D domain
MKCFSRSVRGRGTKAGIVFVAGLLSGFFATVTASAQAPMAAEPAAVPVQEATIPMEALSPEERQKRVEWQRSISQVPLPKKGCFRAAYPSTEWQEVPCTTGPSYPMPPRHGARPFVVGNRNDVAAQVPTGFISTAIGSFDSGTSVTGESGPIGNAGSSFPDTYTLQINTEQFTSTACAGSPNTDPNTGCKGWQQFVFENNPNSHRVGIQYWLIKYNTTCPPGAGWTQFQFVGDTDIYCFKNDSTGWATVSSAQPVANLAQISLTGAVSASGDSVLLTSGGIAAGSVAGDNAVNAAAGWKIAEFNIFGDGGNANGGGQASFNAGSTVVPRTRVIYGGTDPPTCVAQGFTGETNNLSFGPSAPSPSGPGPALIATESSAGGSASNCVAATTVGDTHLTTFGGLLYDFQATGDFLLAETGPDFLVQTRQVSGAPTWPNASVNKAVAVRAGKSRVAICLPGRVVVDGKPTTIRDGGQLALSEGGNVVRKGNVYFVLAPTGDSIRATVNSAYIDVSVGLGRWPTKVRGLLANANGKVNEIEAQDGAVLTSPFVFEKLYSHYADSWRVPPNQSLLSPCGEGVERGIPKKPFFANDLNPKLAERNRAICTQAGVRGGRLLDACMIDVAMLGSGAAKVFAGMLMPIVVGDAR